MKSSTRDKFEGKMHQVKGKAMEIFGKAFNNPDLESRGQVENFKGKSQGKMSTVKKSFNK
ncbi:MAG: CsbD family protein [Desulfonatronovibrio sp.]